MKSEFNRYVVLLRGINVGGNNMISMNRLKEKLVVFGFCDVETYINSGNILVSSIEDSEQVKRDVGLIIKREFDLDINVYVIKCETLIEVSQSCPDWWNQEENVRQNVLFVIPPLTVEQVNYQIGELNPTIEKSTYTNQVIFWSVKNEYYSKSKYSKILNKSFYSNLTIRNANTFNKLVDLCQK